MSRQPQEIYSPIPRHLSIVPSLSNLSISDQNRVGSSSSRRYNDSSRGSRIYTATPSSTSISDVSISDGEDEGDTLGEMEEARSWLDMTGPSTMRKGKGREKEEVGLAGRLPNEILIQILRLLPDNRSLLSALLVSRSWCLCTFPLIWMKPQISSILTLASLIRVISPIKNLPTTLPYSTSIRRIHLTQLSHTLSDELFAGLKRCTKLERLTLSGCTNLSSGGIVDVIRHLNELVSIDLSGIPSVDDRVLVELGRSCRKLQAVNLSECRLIGDEGVLALGRGCRGLRRAKFSRCHRLTSHSLIPFVKNCTLLLELDLQDVLPSTNSTVFTIFLNLTYLRDLKLNNCTELNEECIPNLVEMKSMSDKQLLELGKSIGLDEENIPDISFLRPRMNHLDHLRVVDFTGCSNLGDKAIDNLISNAPKLRTLTLTKCSNLTNTALESIERLGKHLHYLHLGHVKLITDSGVIRLAKICNRLRYIDLACCDLLTDESIMELGAYMPKLRRVGLVKVINITDDSLYALVDRYTALERIHLSYCDNLSIKAISYMLNRLPHLKHLSLTGVSSFRKKELQHFCRAPPDNFNDHQRAAFCVFSGHKVDELRRYLNEVYLASINGGGGIESDSTSTRRNSGSSSTSSITVPGTSSPPFVLSHQWNEHQHSTNTGYIYRRGSAPTLRSNTDSNNISVPGLPSMAFASPTPNFLTPPQPSSSTFASHRNNRSSVSHGLPSRIRDTIAGGANANELSREASASSNDGSRSGRVRVHHVHSHHHERERPIGPRDREVLSRGEESDRMPGGLWDEAVPTSSSRREHGEGSGLGMRWFGWGGDNE
uniref:Uncharacterized protein n=1 Tax=Kwoniella bestiolae CBS 10118 TaxID=1296100 RepID=A0A1B9G8N2_9TREE|nr:hypothetical protein I302_02181 [Kwoniella bestiolae CBS 10118]OCF27340.1 hypothetical protein I302_02181 [Kwoniella bestiolae CBS 10118]